MTSSVAASPIRYDASIEKPEPDEEDTVRGLMETMRGITETTYKDGGHGLRSVHAKTHGLLVGTLAVKDGLPAPLAQGMFAKPGTYPVVVRLSTIPGDIIDDSISVPRGLSIKVIGVDGARLPHSAGDTTQDFVLVNAPAFSAPNPKAFLKTLKLLAATTDQPQVLKKAASTVARAVESVVEAFGGKSPTLTTLGGHPKTNPLGDTYYSQAALLHGDYMAKVAVAPVSASLTALKDEPVEVNDRPNGLRDAVVDFFARQGGEWDLQVQLCTDTQKMPIEDASVEWPEAESPYATVGTISIPPQPAWNETRARALDDGLSFSPWHGLAAHRPIGGVMRVRQRVYEMSAKLRASMNATPIAEPKRLEDLAI